VKLRDQAVIWATGPLGECKYLSPEWTAFTGQSAAEAVGFGWREMLHPDDRDNVQQILLDACRINATFTTYYRLRRQSGTYAHVVAGASPSFSPIDGSFIGYLGSVTEVTELVAETGARQAFGHLALPLQSASTMPTSPLDVLADYILLARAKAEEAGEHELYACLDLAITMVHLKLGTSWMEH
jgi:PAS domain S-box-containing protein